MSDRSSIYTAATEAEAEAQLVAFAKQWDRQYPSISKSCLLQWPRIIPFFAFPDEIRRLLHHERD